MITHEITFTLPGHPAPKGSLKCIGARGTVKHQLIEDVRVGQKAWREAVTYAAKYAAQKTNRKADQYEPVGVEVTLTIDRGPSHFGTGRNAGFLKHTAPLHPTKKNTDDVDKLLRLVLDAMTNAGLLFDDCQVVETTARKSFPVPTRAVLLGGPKPPAWADSYVPLPDALPHPGARIRLYPVNGGDRW